MSLKETILLAAGCRGGFDFAWDGRLGMEGSSDGLNRTRGVQDLLKDIEAEMREAMRKRNLIDHKKTSSLPSRQQARDIFTSGLILSCIVSSNRKITASGS